MKVLSQNTAFGGMQGVFSHGSEACGCEMTFAVSAPPQAIARLKAKALEEGLPYQTLINSILHKYVS